MTVIAVASDGKRCVMAADSQATNNGQVAIMGRTKVIVRTGAYQCTLLGCAGSLKLCDLLEYLPDAVLEAVRPTFHEWLVRDLSPAIHAGCVAHGLMVKRNDGDEWPGNVLVARGGKFALLEGQGGVLTFDRPWHAMGSGGAEARGVLQYLYARRPANIVTAVVAAVEAACCLDDKCSLPSTIAST